MSCQCLLELARSRVPQLDTCVAHIVFTARGDGGATGAERDTQDTICVSCQCVLEIARQCVPEFDILWSILPEAMIYPLIETAAAMLPHITVTYRQYFFNFTQLSN